MTDAPAPVKSRAEVMYYPGVTIVSGVPAAIEWGADDRIRMWSAPAGGAPELVFDASPAEMTVKGRQTVLNLVIGGRPHRVDFAAATGVALRGLGVAGMIGSQVLTGEVGIRQWLDALRGSGATIRYRSARSSVLITLGVVVAFLVLIGVVVGIAAFN
jgi:hypothetical protein